jgi:hypothetical protein
MKGTILGADANEGTISGVDGRRYKFDLREWKSERKPGAGDEVDFEVREDGRAAEVFSLRSGLNVDLSDVSNQAKQMFDRGVSSPMGDLAIRLLKENLIFQLSLAVVLASVLFPYVSGLAAGVDKSFNLISVGSFADQLKNGLDEAATMLEGTTGLLGSILGSQQQASGSSSAGALHFLAAASLLFYLAYLAPLGALFTLVQMLRRQPLGALPLGTGAACILSFILLIGLRTAVSFGVGQMGLPPNVADAAAHSVGLGFGAWIVLLCGCGLVASSLGLIRRPA